MAIIETQGFKLDNSGKRIVVDPITRIEGHLRIEVNVDDKNVIRNAVSTGTMWRGLEVILKGRDPRDAWAFVERICGVCTGTHALASVRSVEDALGIQIPKNANLIRNLMHSHAVCARPPGALLPPACAGLGGRGLGAEGRPEADERVAAGHLALGQLLAGLLPRGAGPAEEVRDSGQLGIFANGYWGSAAYKLPPEANLMATAHYLEALDFQKEIVKIQTIFGGKNPHPNWLVGGVPCSINVDGTGAVGAINMFYLNMVGDIINRTIEFIDQVYVPDLLAIASFYKDWAQWGGGLSGQNVMSYGEFPDIANDYSNKSMLLPSGVILGGNLKEVLDVDLKAADQVQEWVTHSWYKQGDETKGLHPFDGVTEPNFDIGKAKGTRTNIENFDESSKYSWIKSPRWKGHAVEVGPLARYIVGYARGNEEIKAQVDMVLKTLDVPDHRPLLHPRPHRGARAGGLLGGAQDEVFLRPADRQPEGRRPEYGQCREVGTFQLAGRSQGRGAQRSPARCAGALGEDQGQAHRQLPVRGAHDLECRPARRQGPDRRLRGLAAGHADGQPGAAAGDPAHDPQFRPLPGLRDARHVARGPGARVGEGALKGAPRRRRCKSNVGPAGSPAARWSMSMSTLHRCACGTG